jgi:hypothetical protein
VALASVLDTLRKIWSRAQQFLRSTFQGDYSCDGQEVLGWAQQWSGILNTRTIPGLSPLQCKALEYVALQHLGRGFSTVTAPCSEVADYCGVTKRAAWKTLKALVEDGLLVKISAGSPILAEHNAAIFQITNPDTYFGEVNDRRSLQVTSTKESQTTFSTPSTPLVGGREELLGVLKAPRRHRPLLPKEELQAKLREIMGIDPFRGVLKKT